MKHPLYVVRPFDFSMRYTKHVREQNVGIGRNWCFPPGRLSSTDAGFNNDGGLTTTI